MSLNLVRDESLQIAAALEGFDAKRSMLYASGDRLLITDGIFARIDAPAADASDADGALQQSVAAAFRRARLHGIDQPIVVGSIPFDTTRPSNLFVPERYRWVQLAGGPATGAEVAPPSSPALLCPEERDDSERASFQDAVRFLLDEFRANTVQKVVLARMLQVDFSTPLDINAVVLEMLRGCKASYRFSVPVPGGSTLVGASPELLVRRLGKYVECNPLAGTIPKAKLADRKSAADYLLQSPKDRLEHRLVIDQIREALAVYCTDVSAPVTPTLLPSANLWHLSTFIEGALKTPQHNALTLVGALHPTPAVCGYPTAQARDIIGRVESFDRGLFTGTTGWMDAHGDGEWAVTIRCSLVSEDRACVYAGAGIVSGSVPEDEWSETAAKMQPMLRTISAASGAAKE